MESWLLAAVLDLGYDGWFCTFILQLEMPPVRS
jgi:hypothetical protein